ncbi:DUF4870 domain-containing protein [Halosimplex aquaticum]|uniref:DUF4870 domain-containing protein n=1 Tax=Halosimplex aquaticum TaxID=3026162 RepID=A0ABD5Y5H9_9EURY|nr:DUF4870 domain-containing protein [Halosimplex aquaticum]
MSTPSPPSDQSPDLLNQRPLAGIAVHLLAFPTGIFGAGLVYLLASHEFTRANARNALNWHLSLTVLLIATLVVFFLGADEIEVSGGATIEALSLPAPLNALFSVAAIVLGLSLGIAVLLNFVFAVVATAKAIFGTAWKYPFAYPFVGDD